MNPITKLERYVQEGKYGGIAFLAFMLVVVVATAAVTLLLHIYAPNFCGSISKN